MTLQGRSTKAQRNLKWKPKVHFKELVRMMVDADLERLRNGQPGDEKHNTAPGARK